MRWWYLLFLALPIVSGVDNARAGGEFFAVFAAALIFSMLAIGSLEAAVFVRRLLRRQRPNASLLQGMAT
jgi:uncharacterized membrane protein YhaH (DUF805 family)